jgi:hypothetical protein
VTVVWQDSPSSKGYNSISFQVGNVSISAFAAGSSVNIGTIASASLKGLSAGAAIVLCFYNYPDVTVSV